MSIHGSIQNRMMERLPKVKPEVGMGVTECLWSDRHAWEVIKIINEKRILIRRMGYKCKDYYAGDYEVFPNPDGKTAILVWRYGRWRELLWKDVYKTDKNGEPIRPLEVIGQVPGRKLGRGADWHVGHADEYEDPSF